MYTLQVCKLQACCVVGEGSVHKFEGTTVLLGAWQVTLLVCCPPPHERVQLSQAPATHRGATQATVLQVWEEMGMSANGQVVLPGVTITLPSEEIQVTDRVCWPPPHSVLHTPQEPACQVYVGQVSGLQIC